MSYLLRVQLPDTPGSLGYLAAALGEVDGDIRSVDVVEHDVNGTVTDDIVVDLPSGKLPDTLITAAQTLDGVEVDSIRPFSGTVDRRGQIRLLAAMAAHRNEPRLALREIVDGLSQTMSAGWALALETADDGVSRLAASPAAPEDDGRTLSHPPVTETRLLDPETEDWIPPSWAVMDSALAASPMGENYILVIGRPGGPEFLPSEVEHLGRIGAIVEAILL